MDTGPHRSPVTLTVIDARDSGNSFQVCSASLLRLLSVGCAGIVPGAEGLSAQFPEEAFFDKFFQAGQIIPTQAKKLDADTPSR